MQRQKSGFLVVRPYLVSSGRSSCMFARSSILFRAFGTQGVFDYLFWSESRSPAPTQSDSFKQNELLRQDALQAPDANLYNELFIPPGAATNWGATLSGLLVVPDAIPVEAERSIVAELDPYLSHKVYQQGHWDGVISRYRETERSLFKFSEQNKIHLQRILARHIQPHVQLLPYVHVLDLAPDGEMKSHVDSIKFSGGLVAGLCLLSSCVMRLTHEKNGGVVDILLRPRTFYALTGKARYDWGHGIAGGATSFNGQPIVRERRISLIFRNFAEDDTFKQRYREQLQQPIKQET